MENKFLCVMAGYDDETENYLAGIQKKLYAVGLTGQHTKDIPQHITLQTYPPAQEAQVVQMVRAGVLSPNGRNGQVPGAGVPEGLTDLCRQPV